MVLNSSVLKNQQKAEAKLKLLKEKLTSMQLKDFTGLVRTKLST
jgi:hypothetical protein